MTTRHQSDAHSIQPSAAGAVFAAILTFLSASGAEASCPPGDSNPITSGTGRAGAPVVFSLHPGVIRGSFFLLGAGDGHNSGALPVSAWLVEVGDLDGDGLIEYRLDAPGTGPGGWGDPRVSGCPSTAPTPHPPLVLILSQAREDLDNDVVPNEDANGNGVLDPGEDIDGSGTLSPGAPFPRWDMWEDTNRNGRLDGGEDTHPRRGDLDGRLTVSGNGPYTGGCERNTREDVDCDGHLDWINEDLNGDGRWSLSEDLDGDRRWDNVYEDLNGNGILDGEIDRNGNGILDPDEDLNGNGMWDGEDTPTIATDARWTHGTTRIGTGSAPTWTIAPSPSTLSRRTPRATDRAMPASPSSSSRRSRRTGERCWRSPPWRRIRTAIR